MVKTWKYEKKHFNPDNVSRDNHCPSNKMVLLVLLSVVSP